MTVITEPAGGKRFEGRPRVTVTRRLTPEVEARMTELFDVVLNPGDTPFTRARLIAAMRESDVLVPTVTDRIDAEMIAHAVDAEHGGSGRLRLIASFGAGYDYIDLAAARARRIPVTNTPGVFTDDTADLAMALIMAVPRRLIEATRMMLAGQWTGWGPTAMLGARLGGRRLAIVGMGRIGQAVAHRARAFGLEVVYHNRHRLPTAVENMLGARYEPDLDTMLTGADIVSIHCPAGPSTHHLLDRRRLALLKPEAYLVNTARGEIVDEDALLTALAEGRIAGAGLDVFRSEPHIDPRFLELPNVVLTPHIGSATVEGRTTAGEKVVANIRFWADGHRPPDQVLEGWA
jgi:glyoxylate reductase